MNRYILHQFKKEPFAYRTGMRFRYKSTETSLQFITLVENCAAKEQPSNMGWSYTTHNSDGFVAWEGSGWMNMSCLELYYEPL